MVTRKSSEKGTSAVAVLLSDDEVAALAVDRNTFWPGALPTVDAADASDLARASFRGHRSLVVRGIVGDDGRINDPNVTKFADAVAGRRQGIAVYLSDDDLQQSSSGLASCHYPDGSDWILETISSTGIHRLSRQPADVHRQYLEALLDGAREAGPTLTLRSDVRAVPTWLCMLARRDDQMLATRARRGEVQIGEVTTVGTGVAKVPAFTQKESAQAVAALMELIS